MTIMAHRHRSGIMFTRRVRRIVRPLPAVVGKRQMKSDVIRLFTVQWVTVLYGFCGAVVVIKALYRYHSVILGCHNYLCTY